MTETNVDSEYVLITGSRSWNDFGLIEQELRKWDEKYVLIHGGAAGADSIANYLWTKKLNRKAIACKVTSDDWKQYGKFAGPRRNEQMLADYPIKFAYAFCKDNSKGTMHMINCLHKKNIPVEIFKQ